MTERPDLSRLWAEGGSKRDPGNVKYLAGWIDEIPTYQVLNYLQWRNDVSQLALAERGIPEWGAEITYALKALAWDNIDSKIYLRKVAGTGELAPSLDAINWELSAAQLTAAELNAAVAALATHVADMGNPHNLTPSDIDAYSTTEIDNKFTAADDDLDLHEADLNNPHEVTAAQAGGVPVTGGTYTGQVEFEAEETLFNQGGADAAIRSTSSGFYLRLVTDLLGIDEFGVANFNGSTLVTEDNYAENREIAEPDYATPSPDCNMEAISDINLREGYGFTDFTGPNGRAYTNKSGNSTAAGLDEPRHTARGLMIDQVSETLTIDADQNLTTFAEATVFISGSQGRAETTTFWEDSSIRTDRLWATNLGELKLTVENSVSVPVNLDLGTVTVGEDFRVAITLDGTELKAYLNGVLVASATDIFVPVTYDFIQLGTLALTYLKKFQTWARILTPEQITTL